MTKQATPAQIEHAKQAKDKLNFALGQHLAREINGEIVLQATSAEYVAGLVRRFYEQKGQCLALIHHGPGHQSSTRCELKGEHEVHQVYNVGRWRGDEASTGFFDESPEED